MRSRSWVLLVVLAALWGGSFLLISLSLRGMSAPVVSFGRLAVGAVVLAACALGRDRRAFAVLRGAWPRVALFALCQMAAPYLLTAYAETRVPSGLSAALMASQPMWLILLSLPRVRAAQLAGVAVGFAGVLCLVGPFSGGRPDPTGVLLVVAAAASYAVGALVLARLLPGVPALPVTAAGEAVAALATLPLALTAAPSAVPPLSSVVALVALGALATAGGFALYVRLVYRAGAGPASLVSYIAPVFAFGYGAVLLGERIRPAMIVGLVLILGGSALTVKRRQSKPQTSNAQRASDVLNVRGSAQAPCAIRR